MATTYPLMISLSFTGSYPAPSATISQYSFVFSVSQSDGRPFTGLHQSDLALVLEGSSGPYSSKLIFSGSEQEVDSSGNPVFDALGNPVMVPVPGKVPEASLPGCYRQGLITTSFPTGRVVATLSISTATDSGRALTSFEVR